MKGYVAVGSVRGWCGHVHRTVEAAQRCVENDQIRMAKLGGGAYSDRHIYTAEDLPQDSYGDYYLPSISRPKPIWSDE